MHIIVTTPKGKMYDEEIDYLVVKNEDGEYAILKNHIPDISIIPEGYVKLVRGNLEYYVAVINGVLEFKNNECVVLSQEAHIGTDVETAMRNIMEIRHQRLEENKKINIQMTEQEKELARNIKDSKAGNI